MTNRTGFSKRLNAPWGVLGGSVAPFGPARGLQAGCKRTLARFFGGRIAINHEGPGDLLVTNVETVAPIDDAKDEWIMLSPYGEFPNPLGTQVVNKEVADRIVAAFNSVLGKLGRLFRGVPVYRGHPDAMPDRWPDDIRYGRVNEIEARADGLYGKPAWNSLGTENIEQGFYVYPSPAWHFKRLGDGRIEPVDLVSIGLTNTPNIREVAPLTNSKLSAKTAESEQPPTKENMNREALIKALGLKAEATDAEITTAINSLVSENAIATNAEKNPLVVAANAAKTKAKTALNTAQDEAKKFRKLAVDHDLDLAVNDGRLSAAERPQWAPKFEADFDAAAKELKDKQPALNTKKLNLSPSGKDLSDASKRRIAFNSRLDELMQPDRDGRVLNIDQAIAKMRANPEDAALLKAMQEPVAA